MTSDRPHPPSNSNPAPKRKAEATLVLAERRLDRLRAEVKRRQRWFALQRSGAIVGWMLAGGAAVGIGVFVARSLSETREPASGASGGTLAAMPSASAAVEGVPNAAVSAASASPEVVAPAPEAAPSEPAPPATSAQGAAISLDDLPTRSSVEGKTKLVRGKTATRR